MDWIELYPPKILISGTFECDVIWKKSLCDVIKISVKILLEQGGPRIQYDWCHSKKRGRIIINKLIIVNLL